MAISTTRGIVSRITGTQRLAYTPAPLELVFDTDAQALYCGDGSTVGGLIVPAGALAPYLGIPTSGQTPAKVNQAVTDLMNYSRGNLTPLLRALGVKDTVVLNVYDTGTPGVSNTYAGSTRRAFGGPVGNSMGKFSRVEGSIVLGFPTNPATWPSLLRLRVRDTNKTGTILADTMISISDIGNFPNDAYAWKVDLGLTIDPSLYAGGLWVEIFTNGIISILQTTTVVFPQASGYPVIAASTSNLYGTPSLETTESAAVGLWFRFSLSSTNSVYETDKLAGFPFNSSTFCGASGPVGAPTNFNRIEIPGLAWDSTLVPTQAAVQVRVGDRNGAILLDERLAISPQFSVPYIISLDLRTPINASGQNIWLGFWTDGHFSFANTNTIPYLYSSLMHTTTSTQALATTPGWGLTAPQYGMYAKFSYVDHTGRKLGGVDDATRAIRRLVDNGGAVSIQLPNNIGMVQGKEFNAYLANLLHTILPLSDYEVKITSSIGTLQDERWTAIPVSGDVGSHASTFEVYRRKGLDGIHGISTPLASKTFTIVVRSTSRSSVSRKINWMGDSTLQLGAAPAEAINQLATMGITASFVGTHSRTVSDAGTDGNGTGATSRTWGDEGISGKTLAFFFSDPTSPYVFTGSFNFATYLSTNSLTMTTGDYFVQSLAINDMFGWLTDTDAQAAIGAYHTQLTTISANVRAAVSGIKVLILMPLMPSLHQDAAGANYQLQQTQWRYARNVKMLTDFLLRNWDLNGSSNTWLVPYGMCLDTINNMNFDSAAAVNYYNAATTIVRQNNLVHPATPGTALKGYGQLGMALAMGIRLAEGA